MSVSLRSPSPPEALDCCGSHPQLSGDGLLFISGAGFPTNGLGLEAPATGIFSLRYLARIAFFKGPFAYRVRRRLWTAAVLIRSSPGMADTRGLHALPHISLVLPRFPKKLGIKNPSTPKPVAQSYSSGSRLFVSPAHLHRVFLYALFTHGHGWLHGVPICEAMGLPFPIPEISSVSASMRKHAEFGFTSNHLDNN